MVRMTKRTASAALRAWMDDNGLTYQEVANRIARTRRMAIAYAKGDSIPPDPVKLEIERLTRGAIRAEDWIAQARTRARKERTQPAA